jgi:hypothetical protein
MGLAQVTKGHMSASLRQSRPAKWDFSLCAPAILRVAALSAFWINLLTFG